MASLKLKFIHRFRDRFGRVRFYFRRHGKRTALPGLPGSAEFMGAYQACLADSATPAGPQTRTGSVADAAARYLASPAFADLAPRTRANARSIVSRLVAAHGTMSFGEQLERRHVEMMLAAVGGAHARKALLRTIRAIAAVAIAAGLRRTDPTAGIAVKIRATEGYRTWSKDDIARFEARHDVGSRARLALALLLYTGQRRGDVIQMGPQHVEGGFISVRQAKTGAALHIPVHPELARILAAHPARDLAFLVTERGAPFSPTGFSNWFNTACREAGLPPGLSAHGLRKSCCRVG